MVANKKNPVIVNTQGSTRFFKPCEVLLLLVKEEETAEELAFGVTVTKLVIVVCANNL